MSVNLKLAADVHHWLMTEGRAGRSRVGLDATVERFIKKWPRVGAETLQYVSSMLAAQLHARTALPSQILKSVRKAIADEPVAPRRWWRFG